jgi:hypothetical protein
MALEHGTIPPGDDNTLHEGNVLDFKNGVEIHLNFSFWRV